MQDKIRHVGLDVHRDPIRSAVSEWGGKAPEVLATIPSELTVLLKHLKKPGPSSSLRCCYGDGPMDHIWTVEREPNLLAGKRAEWYAKVLEVVESADLSEHLELYVEFEEWEKLAKVVRKATPKALEDLSHYRTEPAAKKLESRDREAAAKLYRALGLRILNSRKSKYYDEALDHFDRARECLVKEWDSLVSKVRSDHGRKTSFIGRFEVLLSRGTLPKAPSFLERARKRQARRFRTT